MITTFILQILYGVISLPISVLPASQGLPAPIHTALTYVMYQINTWSFIFPFVTVLTILSYTLLIEFSLWTYHGLIWAYNKIRGI